MSKRIVFCADGTWDKAENKTNVYKLYKSLLQSGSQIAGYDDGVGSDGLQIWKLLGGAFGTGLWQKVMDGYTRIAHAYEQDDDIFIFGFSRGAYTARSIAGMIAVCGLPTANFDDNLVPAAFDAYRETNANLRQLKLDPLIKKYQLYDAKITMVGVWDTVGSLGIPAAIGAVDPLLYGFLDTGLSASVRYAYHAVSIDERRGEFPATLWTAKKGAATVLEQVYFTGVHCDVGGGYTETGLSDITLSWMMQKAVAIKAADGGPGILVDPEVWKQYANIDPKHALDQKHESWSPFWAFPKSRLIDTDACLANSVQIRCQEDETYRPRNLVLNNGVPGPTYSISQVVQVPAAAAAGAGKP